MEIRHLLQRAFQAFDEGDLPGAKALYRQCLAQTPPGTREYETVLHGLGYVYCHQSNFAAARRCYEEVLRGCRNRQDKGAEAIALHQLGMVERMAGAFAAALERFTAEAALLAAHLPDDDVRKAANLQEQGYVRLLQGEPEEAWRVLTAAMLTAERSGDPMTQGCVLRALGETLAAMQETRAALKHLAEARKRFRAAGDRLAMAEAGAIEARIRKDRQENG